VRARRKPGFRPPFFCSMTEGIDGFLFGRESGMKTRWIGAMALLGALLGGAGSGFCEEKKHKEMTPRVSVPMIGGIQMKKVGDSAPLFSLDDLEGKPFDLARSVSEGPHLLIFWSIFCEPCKEEMPLIQRLFEQYKSKGFSVLAIAMDGEPMKKSIQGLVRQKGYTFRVFVEKLTKDETYVAADPYGVAGTPTLYLVDRSGKITLAEVGKTSKEVLERAVKKALAPE